MLNPRTAVLCVVALCVIYSSPAFSSPAFPSPGASEAGVEPARGRGADACPIVTLAERQMPLPGGGLLEVVTGSPGVINRKKEVAFVARISGDDRNQGIFVAGPDGLREIIRGCGSIGGQGQGGDCGDPTPIGGTFGGLFDFNNLQPRINDSGDVLFLADISNASSTRGLFLYRSIDQSIVKVVALGDPSPLGGTIEAFGNGIVSEQGQVAFVAFDVGANMLEETYLALWDDGVLEKVVGSGDPAPEGGVVDRILSLVGGFLDDTYIVLLPTPAFDESGRLALSSVEAEGDFGVLLFDEGSPSWLVREGESAPGGGVFSGIGAPMLRNGRVSFIADQPSGGFIGSPGQWQAIWTVGQELDDGTITGARLFGGRHTLDDSGQVTLALNTETTTGSFERKIVRWNETEGLFTLVSRDDPAPNGGVGMGFAEDVSVNRGGDITFSMSFNRNGLFVTGVYRLDNCQVGEVFGDGFESGNTNVWSARQP